MRNKFNISVAEVEAQNQRRKSTIGVACVANGAQNTNRVLSKVVDFIEQFRLVEILDYQIEII